MRSQCRGREFDPPPLHILKPFVAMSYERLFFLEFCKGDLCKGNCKGKVNAGGQISPEIGCYLVPSEPARHAPAVVHCAPTPRNPRSQSESGLRDHRAACIPQSPPNRHAVVQCEPTPRKPRSRPPPSHVRELRNPKITEQPAPQNPIQTDRRRPVRANSEKTASPVRDGMARSPRSLPPESTPNRHAVVQCEPTPRKLWAHASPSEQPAPQVPLRTDTPSSAASQLRENFSPVRDGIARPPSSLPPKGGVGHLMPY